MYAATNFDSLFNNPGGDASCRRHGVGPSIQFVGGQLDGPPWEPVGGHRLVYIRRGAGKGPRGRPRRVRPAAAATVPVGGGAATAAVATAAAPDPSSTDRRAAGQPGVRRFFCSRDGPRAAAAAVRATRRDRPRAERAAANRRRRQPPPPSRPLVTRGRISHGTRPTRARPNASISRRRAYDEQPLGTDD